MTEAESPGGTERFRIASIGRHSLVYGIGMLLSKAVAIVMMPIYTRLLTPADYGVLALITMTFEVVTIVAGSRIAVGVFHYYHKAEGEAARRSVLSTAFLLLGGTYWAAAAGTVYLAPWISGLVFGEGELYVTLVRLGAVSMAFEGLLLVPLALFQLENRSTTFVLVSAARLALQVVLNLLFLIPFAMGVTGVLWGSVVTHAVVATVLAVGLVFKTGARFVPRVAGDFLRFGLPLVVMQIATFVLAFGDRYFLNQHGSTTEVGLYGLAYQFGFLVATLGYSPFAGVWDPQRFAIAKRPDRDTVFSQVFVYLNVVLVSAALGIALFAGDGLRIIAAPEFHRAAVFVPLLAAAYVAQSWSFFLNLGILVTERTSYFTLANWVAAIVAVVGYVWLIPMWLAWGAVIATLASMLVLAGLVHVFSQRLWPVQYRWTPVVRMVALAVGVGVVSELAPALPLLPSMAFHTGLFALYAALLWWLPILSEGERAAIRSRVAHRLRPITRTA